MAPRHRVVILGGGFAGLNAAQKLKRAPVEITLIDRRNFHLFQPLLYQVATGSLSPGEIAAPLRGVLSRQKNAQVLMGEAVDIDPDAKRVMLRDGAAFEYDSLIVATGSKTSYYGHDEWKEWAPSLKTVEEATEIRHKILYAFEWAERAENEEEARAWLTFIIVGAGATGMELAGALAEIANETLKRDFRKINPREARIILMEGGSRVLTAYPEDLSARAEELVKRLGVEIMKGVMMKVGQLAAFIMETFPDEAQQSLGSVSKLATLAEQSLQLSLRLLVKFFLRGFLFCKTGLPHECSRHQIVSCLLPWRLVIVGNLFETRACGVKIQRVKKSSTDLVFTIFAKPLRTFRP